MKVGRLILATVAVGFLVVGLVPAAPAQDVQVHFNGNGSARAADLAIPALQALPGPEFKGVTVGATFAEFTSDPQAAGFAAGQCELLGGDPDRSNLPCTEGTFQTSSSNSNPGDGSAACLGSLEVTVLALNTSCGNSQSMIDDGMPVSLNEAGVADSSVGLDLTPIPGVGSALEEGRVAVINGVSGVLTEVYKSVPNIHQDVDAAADNLKAAIDELLQTLTEPGVQLLAVRVGSAVTNVTSEGATINVASEAFGGTLGILGTDPLASGVIIIDVSAGNARASFNEKTGLAEASATPALATVRVRDLLDLDGDSSTTDYLQASVAPVALNNLLSALNGTDLETTVDVATATDPVTGKSVKASSSGVNIHAIKGVGASSTGAQDGGVILRLATADVALTGDIDTRVEPPHPVTGGPMFWFGIGAGVLALAALALFRLARRLRASA